MPKPFNIIRNNKGMTASVLGGMSVVLLVIVPCPIGKPASLDLFGAAVTLACIALALCAFNGNKQADSWLDDRGVKEKWSLAWLFATGPSRDI